MRIYVAHSREFDYKRKLYIPIRNRENLRKNEIILPHEESSMSSNKRDFYKNIDFIIAECSYPSIGLGIELGWAFDDNIPVYCIHKKNIKISGSINAITQNIFEYSNVNEMLFIIENIINMEQAKRNIKKVTYDG